MDDDDPTPQHVEAKFQPRNLAVLSLEALADYIVELEAEITRARVTISDKEAARDAADSVFQR